MPLDVYKRQGLYIVIERLIDHTNLTYILQVLQIKPEVLTPVKLGITLKGKSPDNVCLVKLLLWCSLE